MARIGYHASHEQFTPRDLLDFAVLAEQAGFAAIMSSDHFRPWSARQGQSGYMWSWVAAALQATSIPVGFITVPGGWRYHPALVAQATATLAQMFPGRLPWVAVGSGEALNECAVGADWPAKDARNARLLAGVEIIRALNAGQEVTQAAPIPTERARLYTRAETPPRLVAGALSVETAEWAGSWADGLITINKPVDELHEMLAAFHRGGGAGKPVLLQIHVSIATDEATAKANAFDQWRSNAITAEQAATLRTPEEFDAATQNVTPEDVEQHVLISADPQQHAAWLAEFSAMGFEEIYVHNVGRNQAEFIDIYGRSVLRDFAAKSGR
jgi:coenzyme F420-dependent glucose-6-phosphate dehydrogenase